MPINKMDATVETYDNIVSEYVNYFKSKNLKGNVQFQKEIDYIVSSLDDNTSILDVGTATGSYPKYLTEKCAKNFHVTGIDSSGNMIKVATQNAPKAEFRVMDTRDLKFDPKSFDAIICFATLIHVDDKTCLKVLDKFDRILKDEGLIAINVLELNNKRKEIFVEEPLNPKYKVYFNRYTRRFFIDYFDKKGYEISKFYDNPLFNPQKIGKELSNDNQFSIIVRKKLASKG